MRDRPGTSTTCTARATFTVITQTGGTIPTSIVAGDAFTVTAVYGQVRWPAKQLSLEFVSGTVSGFTIKDTKNSAH